MKNLILGIALVGCAFGCRSDKNAAVADPSTAKMPAKECCLGKDGMPTKADCCQGKDAAGVAKKSCCQQQQVPQN